MPFFSIIIPVFNRAGKLRRTLGHIAAQTWQDFEIVIVDDGSTDDTPEYLARLTDSKIRIFRQDNAGPSAARNRGMAEARGDIIFYCDSDDALYPHCLEKIAYLYSKEKRVTSSFCNCKRTTILIDDTGTALASYNDSRADEPASLQDFYDWKIKPNTTGISHRAHLKDKLFWKSGFLIEDLEFLMQLAVLDADGFRYVPDKLLDYDHVYGGDGLCSGATYADYAHAFGTIYALHKDDPLMTDPSVYLDRVERYAALHKAAERGKIPPPHLKYFEEFWMPEPVEKPD